MIVQAIGLLDDLDKELNTYAMRVREWYGWHFPEMTRVVTDNLQYAKTVRTPRPGHTSGLHSALIPHPSVHTLSGLRHSCQILYMSACGMLMSHPARDSCRLLQTLSRCTPPCRCRCAPACSCLLHMVVAPSSLIRSHCVRDCRCS